VIDPDGGNPDGGGAGPAAAGEISFHAVPVTTAAAVGIDATELTGRANAVVAAVKAARSAASTTEAVAAVAEAVQGATGAPGGGGVQKKERTRPPKASMSSH
jgi:hypothetical protein